MDWNIVNVGIWMRDNKKFKEGMYLRWAIFATLVVLSQLWVCIEVAIELTKKR